MMKCLVTGGAGFIGFHLCQQLIVDGHEVVCVDNLVTGDKSNVESLLLSSRFSFIQEDITTETWKAEAGEWKLDYIFHLASPASPNRESPRSYINHPVETLLANSLGTYNLLELAKRSGARFLYASSSEVYGNPLLSPQHEGYFGNVNPIGTRSVYDEGKRFGEAITMAYVRSHGINGRIVRIFNTYGPRMQVDDGRVVSNFITKALQGKPLTVYGEGRQTRSFCYVDDMVSGIVKAMFSKRTHGEVINLGNSDERQIKNLALLIKKLTGATSDLVFEDLPPDDPQRRKPDIGKAKRLLLWEPKVSIEEGLKKTIKYFRGVI